MENFNVLFLSWSILGPFLSLIICFILFMYFSSSIMKKDNRLMDYVTNFLIVLGAIAWVVITK